jgi:hypothetical protein
MRPADFLATTHQLHKTPKFLEHYSDLSVLVPEPTEGEIRLAGTRHSFRVLIDVFALPPSAVGLDIWAPSDDARKRISHHRDWYGRINVSLAAMHFDASLNADGKKHSDESPHTVTPPDPRDR